MRTHTEDDDALAEALQFALTQAGYAVDRVANGAAADEALKDDVFRLLILDLGLPKLDGFEVLRRLRRRNTTLPVLILSGREKPEEKVMGLDLGADDYLAKPFSVNELQARVRALLRRVQGAAAPIVSTESSRSIPSAAPPLKGRALPLSLHENGVWKCCCTASGASFSKEHLLEQLYSTTRTRARTRSRSTCTGCARKSRYGRVPCAPCMGAAT